MQVLCGVFLCVRAFSFRVTIILKTTLLPSVGFHMSQRLFEIEQPNEQMNWLQNGINPKKIYCRYIENVLSCCFPAYCFVLSNNQIAIHTRLLRLYLFPWLIVTMDLICCH